MFRTAVFVQARMNSKRLPGKMMLEIEGKTLLWHNLTAAKQIKADNYVLLCPAQDEKAFADTADEVGFDIVYGPEDDVLERFIVANEIYKPDKIVRITGDKAAIAEKYQNMLIYESGTSVYDMYDYTYFNEEYVLLRQVTGGVFSGKFFDMIADRKYRASITNECIEHIIHCEKLIKAEKKEVSIMDNFIDKKYRISLTVDTQKDYDNIKEIFSHLYKGAPIKFEDIITSIHEHEHY